MKRWKLLAATVGLAAIVASPFAYAGGGHGYGKHQNQSGYCVNQNCDQQNNYYRYGNCLNQNRSQQNNYGYGNMNGKGNKYQYGRQR